MAPRPVPPPFDDGDDGAQDQRAKSWEEQEREILERLRGTPPEIIKGRLAWKSWAIVYVRSLGGPLLASPHYRTLWESPLLTAHRSPLEEVKAGIYSWAKEEDFRKDVFVQNGSNSVVGKVEVLGDLLFCKEEFDVETKGYRSLEAEVKELACNLCPKCWLRGGAWVDLFVVLEYDPRPGDSEINGYCGNCWETDLDLRRLYHPMSTRIWTAEEMQKILESRYGCPVLPAPPWVLKGEVLGKVGGKYLVVMDEKSRPAPK